MKPIFIPDPRIKWEWLSNHAEVMYLEQHLDKVDWYTIAENPNAMALIVEHFEEKVDCFDWFYLLQHPSILSILNKPHLVRLCAHKLDVYYLNRNQNAFPFLETHLEYIEWDVFSRHSNAVSLLEQNLDKIDWCILSKNPNAVSLLEQNPDKIDLSELCSNPNAITLLSRHLDSEEINWEDLSGNPNAVPLLEQRPDKIDWEEASSNLSISILPLLEKHLDKVYWDVVCCNGEDTTQEAIDFLEKHVDYMDYGCWYRLSALPIAVPLLEKYPEHIHWARLSRNAGAIHLLEQHPEKIDWDFLSFNTNAMHLLFRLDHPRMREDNESFREELMAYVFEPERLIRLSEQYSIDLRTYLQMY